jgi:hypothetical protein
MKVSAKYNLLSKELLQHYFNYDDGELYWKNHDYFKNVLGKKAGSKMKTGYYHICLNQQLYLKHRLIFLYHHGYLPECIDHQDGDKDNNRIENLRPANYNQNGYNQKIAKHNKSGYKGVCWNEKHQRWRAQVGYNNKMHYLGSFISKQDAIDVVTNFRKKYHKNFAREA